jgi:hypothetical protein
LRDEIIEKHDNPTYLKELKKDKKPQNKKMAYVSIAVETSTAIMGGVKPSKAGKDKKN